MRHGLLSPFVRWCAAAAALAVSTSTMASPLEHGVDVQGTVGSVPLAYGDHTVNAALASVVETDSYTFAGVAGDVARIGLRTFNGSVDGTIVLRGPGGTVVGTTGCNTSFSGCSAQLNQALPSTGTYTINILDAGQNEAGVYQMHLEQAPPSQNMLGVRYDTQIVEMVGHTTDQDFYAFYANPNTLVRVALTSFTGSVDSTLEIWDPAGTRTAIACNTSFAGCATLLDVAIGAGAGPVIYRLAVSDGGLDEAGQYGLQISCLFGNCPTAVDLPPPFPVPEPATWLLMSLGAAAVVRHAYRRAGRDTTTRDAN